MTPSLVLFECDGGSVLLPGRPLNHREDGGHLIVNPPREVWERSALTPAELTRWSMLVAATGQAMLEVLPQLAGACLNYWEAGNWSLNDEAEPRGPKDPQVHRRVHLHVLGRSRTAAHPGWAWGESPRFPGYADSVKAPTMPALHAQECAAVAGRIRLLMQGKYAAP